jgi:hypothetical protein
MMFVGKRKFISEVSKAESLAESIKPANHGKSDFFSWQLYRWAKQKPLMLQIWEGTWNSVSGTDRGHPVLYIGYMDSDTPGEKWLHGRKLRELCCHGQNIEGCAYGPGHDTAHWKEITKEWWKKYMRIGVCAIHGDFAHNWNESGDTRICEYCGKKEHKQIEMVEKVTWVAI